MVNKNGSMKIDSATIDFDSETNKEIYTKNSPGDTPQRQKHTKNKV